MQRKFYRHFLYKEELTCLDVSRNENVIKYTLLPRFEVHALIYVAEAKAYAHKRIQICHF